MTHSASWMPANIESFVKCRQDGPLTKPKPLVYQCDIFVMVPPSLLAISTVRLTQASNLSVIFRLVYARNLYRVNAHWFRKCPPHMQLPIQKLGSLKYNWDWRVSKFLFIS